MPVDEAVTQRLGSLGYVAGSIGRTPLAKGELDPKDMIDVFNRMSTVQSTRSAALIATRPGC